MEDILITPINAHLFIYNNPLIEDISLDTIFNVVCKAFGVDSDEAFLKGRKRIFVEVRQVFYSMAY